MERIQKVIANCGYCSRRKAEELISLGKVRVNGEIVRELGFKVNMHDLIEVNGEILDIKEDVVAEAVIKAGFEIIEVLHDGEWCAIVAKRK